MVTGNLYFEKITKQKGTCLRMIVLIVMQPVIISAHTIIVMIYPVPFLRWLYTSVVAI